MVIAVQQLVPTNRALRAVWQSRETSILTLIRDILATPLCTLLPSACLLISMSVYCSLNTNINAHVHLSRIAAYNRAGATTGIDREEYSRKRKYRGPLVTSGSDDAVDVPFVRRFFF
jgi:hypothetical protein